MKKNVKKEKKKPKKSFFDLKPWDWGEKNKDSSKKIDKIIYGENL